MTPAPTETQEPDWRGLDGVYLGLAVALAALGLAGAFTVNDLVGRISLLLVGLIGLLLPLPHRFLQYELGDTAVHIRTLTRTHDVPLKDVTRARLVRLSWRSFREFGASLPGYHVGMFRMHGLGPVWAAGTRLTGTAILLERVEGRPMLLTPTRPHRWLSALEKRDVVVGAPAV